MTVDAIVAAREEGGPFRSLFDFCARVDRSRLNKRALEALIRAGALDSLHLNRAELLASGVVDTDTWLARHDAIAVAGGTPYVSGRSSAIPAAMSIV